MPERSTRDDQQPRPDLTTPLLRLIGHPLTLGAFALLAVNDHVLKSRYPGLVTGKLSDVAGLVGVTVVLGVLVERPRVAAIGVSIGFTLLKVVPGVAEALSPLVGGVGVRDASDLVALAVVVPTARWTSREMKRSNEKVGELGFSLALIGALVVLLAGTATSCVIPPQVDGFVVGPAGKLYAHIKDSRYTEAGNEVDASRWAVSDDGGQTFRRTTRPQPSTVLRGKQACGRSSCFRIRDSSIEERGANGRWSRSFFFSHEQRDRLKLRDQDCGWSTEQFMAIAAVERPDGEHVVVAMGTQGALHRTPDGEWQRRAVLDRKPIKLTGPSWLSKLTLTPLLVVMLGVALLVTGWRRRGRALALEAFAMCFGSGLGLLCVGGALFFFGVDYTILGPAIALLSVVVFGVSLAFAFRRRPPLPPLAETDATAPG